MKIVKSAIDIESLGNPENSGYQVVIPNYAIVRIPDSVDDSKLEWLYVQMPVQPQLDEGLKVGASTLDFWHNSCATDFPDAHNEMIKSYSLESHVIHTNSKVVNAQSSNLPLVVQQFLYDDSTGKVEGTKPHLYGNGCHFDCSLLQENHRVMYGNADLWHYSSPQNARTLKDLINDEQRVDMDHRVAESLRMFCRTLDSKKVGFMDLHHPLYDAAREALQISYCIEILNQK